MTLTITDDFDLERIADSGQCFRWEKNAEGDFRVLHGAHCLYVASLGGGRVRFSCEEAAFNTVWADYFDLKESYAAIRARIDRERDGFLWSAAEHERGIRILRQDPWEMLITFIISQNRNIPCIRKSVDLLSKAYGKEKTDCRGRAYRTFPTPDAIASLSERELLACGLGYRWKYVRSAAEAVADGSLDLEGLRNADEEHTIKTLTALYGVGGKVASCVSLFGLHHLDAFPKDVWIRRILEREYRHGYPFSDYAPYNGVYQQYMFAYYRKMSDYHHKETALLQSGAG